MEGERGYRSIRVMLLSSTSLATSASKTNYLVGIHLLSHHAEYEHTLIGLPSQNNILTSLEMPCVFEAISESKGIKCIFYNIQLMHTF